jgi:hypothetical protein
MKKKIAFAVFTFTDSGLDYMIQGNFGNDQEAAQKWAENHAGDLRPSTVTELIAPKYPNGLIVKEVKY